jgi:hypothetical protein
VKPSASHHQLDLQLSGDAKPRMVKTTAKANKRGGARIASIPLPIKERRFLPVVVGEKWTRAECPTQRPCPRIRCRQHLFLQDAEHRAGRPGLSSVPRNARGLTIAVEGPLGDQRPGTTVDPRWLELERRCHVWIERDEEGVFVTLHASYEREWEHFRERLHIGEAIDVLVDGNRVGGARMTPDGVALDHQPQWFAAVLERVRGVPSCALDEIERHGQMTNDQVGDALGRHRTLVGREVRRAAIKLKAMGVDLRDLIDKDA